MHCPDVRKNPWIKNVWQNIFFLPVFGGSVMGGEELQNFGPELRLRLDSWVNFSLYK